ncbi:endolytic transglycosylase MltG [Butyrivibrio sp. YAB3001]|uniref:endolytic transglycosylase MltG n=1 Tax=Butyrivibrio sp. YAB3001 TaxID=1520812 RepID=UPI0008F6245F|nr:endolytic transglycosylase MltG [Butyrivibrio sp. YAB3001]SFC18923.1 UPF0755 protein [Butyrivibrio sp. YAB3001]
MNLRKIGLGLLDAIVKIAFVIVVVTLISKYSKIAYNYGYHIFNQIPVSSGTGRTVKVTISSGDGASEIGEKLASVGLITDKNLFRLQEQFSDYHGLEVPGTYELSTAMTPEEMLQIMAANSSDESGTSASGSDNSSSEEKDVSGETAESSEESNGG